MASVRFRPTLAAVLAPAGARAGVRARALGRRGSSAAEIRGSGGRARSGPCRGERRRSGRRPEGLAVGG